MARVEGFEPPTAWFVARYSIQLSYTRTALFQHLTNLVTTLSFLPSSLVGSIYLHKMARVEGFEPPTAWFVARYSIQLSYTRVKRITIL
jgi:hypothetical protein